METELLRAAAKQSGVLSSEQIGQSGHGRDWIRWRVQQHGWRRIAHGVYLLPGHQLTVEARMHAAGLVAARRSGMHDHHTPLAFSGRTATWLLGVTQRPRGTLLAVRPHALPRIEVPGVTIRRTRTLRSDDVTMIDGLPSATLARACLDLASMGEPRQRLRGLLIDARQQRHDVDAVAARAQETLRFKGRGQYLRLLASVVGSRADSVFAADVQGWLHDHGFTTVAEHPIATPTGVVHGDLAMPRLFLCIECDGLGFHQTREQLSSDARRSNGLSLAMPWVVLRLTWDRWKNDPDGFLRELNEAVRLQQARLPDLGTSCA